MTTLLQKAMLIRIAEDEFTPVNGTPPTRREYATTWADCVIETAQDKGVVTSMINAGLVNHSGGGRDAAIDLTEAGFQAYLEARKEN